MSYSSTKRAAPAPEASRLAGMLALYYVAHDEREQWSHRAIVERRGDLLVMVEPCPGPLTIPGTTWLCAVRWCAPLRR